MAFQLLSVSPTHLVLAWYFFLPLVMLWRWEKLGCQHRSRFVDYDRFLLIADMLGPASMHEKRYINPQSYFNLLPKLVVSNLTTRRRLDDDSTTNNEQRMTRSQHLDMIRKGTDTPVNPVVPSSPSKLTDNVLLSQIMEYTQFEAMLNAGIQVSPNPISEPARLLTTPKIAFGSQEIVCGRDCQDRSGPWARCHQGYTADSPPNLYVGRCPDRLDAKLSPVCTIAVTRRRNHSVNPQAPRWLGSDMFGYVRLRSCSC
jgi:hypothetical protein